MEILVLIILWLIAGAIFSRIRQQLNGSRKYNGLSRIQIGRTALSNTICSSVRDDRRF
jgi:hypothetical protein